MEIEEGYRIPKEEEFVQGFEFERKDIYQPMMLNLINNTCENIGEPIITWTPMKVWWMHEPNEIITREIDGMKFIYNGFTANFFKPFDVKSFIEQGLIRVKI